MADQGATIVLFVLCLTWFGLGDSETGVCSFVYVPQHPLATSIRVIALRSEYYCQLNSSVVATYQHALSVSTLRVLHQPQSGRYRGFGLITSFRTLTRCRSQKIWYDFTNFTVHTRYHLVLPMPISFS